MKKLLLYGLMVLALVFIQGWLGLHAYAQKNDALRIEIGNMIIRFDKRTGDEYKKLLKYFNLSEDSVWNNKNIGELAKDGWKVLHMDKYVVEITKPVDTGKDFKGGMPIYTPKHDIKSMPGYPGPVEYGVNNFKSSPTVFENKKDETVFVLKG